MTAEVVRPAGLRTPWVFVSVGTLVVVSLISVLLGPANLAPFDVIKELLDRLPFIEIDSGLSDRQAAIVWVVRLPRVVLGALVGAMLALAGAAYQGVFRNPLADPYLLGVAAGAGLGATMVIAFVPATTSWPIDPLPVAAFVGSLVGVGATYLLGRSVRGGRSATTLILAGVAVAAFLTAAQTYVQQRETDTLRQVYAWILGRLTTVGWGEVLLVLPYVAVSTAVILAHRRLLDVLAVGDEEAQTLGLRTSTIRAIVIVAASLGTAAVVAVSGLIGFVGIIVPHTVRLLFGWSYRIVLPLALFAGAAFLVTADLLARTLTTPAELPIGIVTAFIGAPFFAMLLRSREALGS